MQASKQASKAKQIKEKRSEASKSKQSRASEMKQAGRQAGT